MGGSSAIITAAFRALTEYYGIEIPKPLQPNLILETETRELGVGAGLQDRVAQVYEGLVYMDFSRELMVAQHHGYYENLDPSLLPSLYVAYRTSLSEGTEVFHNNIRERWRSGDPEIVNAMKTWAGYAVEGKEALLRQDYGTLNRLIDANFDLRSTIYKLDEGNLEMVRKARSVGASANFAGSGGAIVGIYDGEAMFDALRDSLAKVGVAVIKPQILPD